MNQNNSGIHSSSPRYKKLNLAILSALALGSVPSMPGFAQDNVEFEEILVTGSRIVRRDYNSTSPIVSLDNEVMKYSSSFTIDRSLEKLPQFAGSSGGQNGVGDSLGLSTLNLRNLGDNRNLVLLDGRRLQPSSSSFAVDINTIPSALIETVEVISGGASAVYGSDAISGVVNFKLKNNFEGLEVDLKLVESGRGDYTGTNISLVGGTNMADGRGNIAFGLSFMDRGEVWRKDVDFYKDTFADGTNASTFAFLGTGYYNPVGPPNPIGFNTDNTSLFSVNTGAGYTGGFYPENPLYIEDPNSGAVSYNSDYAGYATTPLERYTGFAKMNYDLSENTEFYMQGMYSSYSVKISQFPMLNANFWSVSVPRDGQHFTNAAFESVLDARPSPTSATDPWVLNRTTDFSGYRRNEISNNVFQVVTGLTGAFLETNLTWDAYASHGRTEVTDVGVSGRTLMSRTRTLVSSANFGAGFNDGTGTCSSGISPFIAAESITSDCIDYISFQPKDQIIQEQDVVEANLQGALFELPAGEVLFSAGASYRENTYSSSIDSGHQADPTICPICSDGGEFAQASRTGETDVTEVYGEFIIPLLNDLPMIDSLELGLAYRYSDYNTVGNVDTYKADLNWAVSDQLYFRAGYQRAVRAPNPIELFSSRQSALDFSGSDPCVSVGPFANMGPTGNSPNNPDQLSVQQLCAELSPGSVPTDYLFHGGSGSPVGIGSIEGGGAAMKQESADTYTIGVVYQSADLVFQGSDLNFSIDYYSIELEDAIGTLSAFDSYDQCFNTNGISNPGYDVNNQYCQRIIRQPAPNGGPATVLNVYENQGGIETSGVDIQIDYGVPVGDGDLKVVLQSSHLLDFEKSILPGDAFVDYAGTGTYFDFRSLLTTTYSLDKSTFGMRWKFLPSVSDEAIACVTVAVGCRVDTDSYSEIDLFGTYSYSEDLQFSAGIDNALDEDPVRVYGQGISNPAEYDMVGRTYYVGLTAKF